MESASGHKWQSHAFPSNKDQIEARLVKRTRYGYDQARVGNWLTELCERLSHRRTGPQALMPGGPDLPSAVRTLMADQ
jgi:hypothetical protein